MKTIELIDKYRIEQPEISEYNSYNPPNYIWTDNTGEIVRCKDCRKYKTKYCTMDQYYKSAEIYKAKPDDYCSRAERRADG